MGTGVYFPLSALTFSIILIILLVFKKHIKTMETKLYSTLVITNFIGLIIELLCTVAAYFYYDYTFIANIILKLYLAYLITWAIVFTIYVYYISSDNKKVSMWLHKYKKLCVFLYSLVIILLFLLPIKLVIENDFAVRYTEGSSVTYTYIFVTICILILLFCMIKNFKHIKSKKYLPLFAFLFFGTIAMTIQMSHPEILLMTYIETVIVTIMYFTIENPDVKMLNELYKNKELTEQNYEEKYNFLFEITQEARNPLVKINSICNEIHNEDNKDKIKVGTDLISSLVRQLDFSINNVLNISTLDIQKLKIVDSKYNLNTLCNDLVKKIQSSIKDGVELHSEIPSSSLTLYGDYMKIKQILYSLLNNAVKNTENGFIEFKVNIIEKYDICRLIFNISDSGKGMPIEQINEILSTTGELDKQELENLEKSEFNIKLCQKVVKIMGGNLMIKSEIGKGTEVLLTFDQRVYHDKENSILNQYENSINNYKKVLIVSQDDRLVKKLKRKCQESNISYTTLLYGGDAVDRIKAGKKYDYILILDEMKEMSGLKTYQEMRKVEGFKTPVIVMLKEDKEHIKEHYLEDGFSDYLLLNDFDKEIERIINKY